ncbi:MAG: ATP-binding protein [Nitrosomonadales bacterium]|nr:ATP-binding protein [Nitrosomonadales bacterium]
MKNEIEKLLRESPSMKAKDIAKKLQLDKSTVNSFLHAHPEHFKQDENFCWSLNYSELRIVFPADCWVDCTLFERILSETGSPISSHANSIIFVISDGCALMLEAIARLMALSNQLAYYGKQVTIDFTHSTSTLTYLDRLGFFDHLIQQVNVLPNRPEISAATTYRGNSENLVEIGAIDPASPDESIPKQLKESFVSHAGNKYSIPAFTVLSELFGNVLDHSESPIPGFVALQFYKKHGKHPAHIQTVISDSGKGIIGTLEPVLAKKYPELFKEITESESPAEKMLLQKVFTQGEISQTGDKGRGLGLKRSFDEASKFCANIIVRQENCEARILYRNGKLKDFRYEEKMPRILGTHICFDFFL